MITFGLLLCAAVMLLLGPDWRWQVLALALGVAALLAPLAAHLGQVPLAAWLFASWMAAAVLGGGVMSLPRRVAKVPPLWGARLSALAVVAAGVWLGAERLLPWFGEGARILVLGALFWALVGVLQVSLASHPWSLTSGILATLSAGTALFGLLEPSRLLLAGLLGLQLIVAWLGAYAAHRVQEVSG